MCALLDLVREKIKELENYRDTKVPKKPHPMLREGEDYLSKYDEGSYRWFIAKEQVDVARRQDKRNADDHEERLKEHKERKGIEEKKHAVEALLKQFISLEKTLLDKGAKTFRELHPDTHDNELPGHHHSSHHSSPPKTLEIKFEFQVHDMTDETHDGYIRL
jgi:hypothetical protein